MSRAEDRILTEMEDHLRMADPAFVARMTLPKDRRFPTVTVLLTVAYVLAPLAALLFGGAVAAYGIGLALIVMVGVLIRRRRVRS